MSILAPSVVLFSILQAVDALRVRLVQQPPTLTPGAQNIITWQRTTQEGHIDPPNWSFEHVQNGSPIGVPISVPDAGGQQGTMTLTIPPEATPGQKITLVAIDAEKSTTFATPFGAFRVTSAARDPQTTQQTTDLGPETTPPSTGSNSDTSSNSMPSSASITSTSPSTSLSNDTSVTPSVTGPVSSSSLEASSTPTSSTLGTIPTTPESDSSSMFVSPSLNSPGEETSTSVVMTTSSTVAAATRNHPSNLAAIITGSVLGGLALILLLTLISCLLRRRATRRKSLAEPINATSFHRDMMIRNNSDTLTSNDLKLKDSQVFTFKPISTSPTGGGLGLLGLGLVSEKEKEKTKVPSVRRSSMDSSSSIDDNEVTPSLARYSSTREPIIPKDDRDIRSPATTSIYSTAYTVTNDHDHDKASETHSDYPLLVPSRPGLNIPARTDRQMNIQEQIMDLQRQMIGVAVRDEPRMNLNQLREKIKRLEEVYKTDWALELTDVLPPGFSGSELGQIGIAQAI